MRIVGGNLLRQLGIACVALILGTALLQKIVAETPEAGAAVFLALLMASPVAYLIREAQKRDVRRQRQAQHSRERTRAAE